MTGLPGNNFGAGNSFVFGFVREHRAGDHVADRVNAFDIRAKVIVDLDPLLVIELDAHLLRAESFRERPASDRYKHFIGVEFYFFISFCCGRRHAAVLDLDCRNFCFEMKRHSLRSERTLQQVRQF